MNNLTQELSYYQKNREKCRAQARARHVINREKNNKRQKEYNKVNKELNKKQSKLYYLNKKEYIKESSKLYRSNNKEQCSALYKEYYIKNKEKQKEKRKDYHREYRKNNKEKIRQKHKKRYEADIQYRLSCNLRSKLYNAIKCVNTYKSKSTESLLGCDFNTLKQYLEERFEEGMNWNNHTNKGWHIDHIIPSAFFDLTNPDQQKLCFHYTNLRPLWYKENLAKNSIYNGKRHFYKKPKNGSDVYPNSRQPHASTS